MTDKMIKAINEQINAELYSSYLYLAMSAYCESLNFNGAAGWFQVQAYEEVTHAMKFYHYLSERGARVELKAIEQPPVEWNSVGNAFAEAYKHEQKVTSLINALVKLAREEDDYATENMLQWFVAEQVEEEASASEIADKYEMIGDNMQALFMIDSELAQRQAPVALTPNENE